MALNGFKLLKPPVRPVWITETHSADHSNALAQQFYCLCTGFTQDLLTFPTGAVNLCLSVHF